MFRMDGATEMPSQGAEPELEAINASVPVVRAAKLDHLQRDNAPSANNLDANIVVKPSSSSAIKTPKEVIGNLSPVNMPNSDTNNDSYNIGDTLNSRSRTGGSFMAPASTSYGIDAFTDTQISIVEEQTNASTEWDLRPPRPSHRTYVDGVQMMHEEASSLPPSETDITAKPRSPDTTLKVEDNWSTTGGAASRDPSEVGSSHHSSASPKIDLSSSSLSGENRCSPDKSILNLLDEDVNSAKSDKDGEEEMKPYSHVTTAHEILNSFIALAPSSDRVDDFNTLASVKDRLDNDVWKPSSAISREASAGYTRKKSTQIIPSSSPKNVGAINSGNSTSTNEAKQQNDASASSSPNKVCDKKKLNERLRQRLAERNHIIQTNSTGKNISLDKLTIDTQYKPETHKRVGSCSSEHYTREPMDDKAVFDTFRKYGISPTGRFPDIVSFDSKDSDSRLSFGHRSFRKSSSETGVTPPARAARVSMHRRVHPPHGISIIQNNGAVFDDDLLLRLARQSRYSKLRGDHATANTSVSAGATKKKYNVVKIHVYDLLQKDALVEMPVFNCNFPIGQCFNVMNNAANCLGTGAYHVGVEVNGIEYAFGANNIAGMSGVFTCSPKQSPGYEYRETLDFGSIYSSRNTWIRIPKENALGRSIGNVLYASRDALSTKEYMFKQIETFADGNAIIHSMAKEYMGTDYDLLRKNCCTFARDVCLRLGVKEEDIPSWFHNAAQAGADAEDAIINAEQTVKNMFDCAVLEGDPTDVEGHNHGFEVIAGSSKLKVVESSSMHRHATARQPLLDEDHSDLWETLSWTY